MKHTIDLSVRRRNLPELRDVAGATPAQNLLVLDLVGLDPLFRVTVKVSNPDGQTSSANWIADQFGFASLQLQTSTAEGLGSYEIRVTPQGSPSGSGILIGRGWIDYKGGMPTPRADS